MRVAATEAEKVELSEKIAAFGRPLGNFDDAVRTAVGFSQVLGLSGRSGHIECNLLLKLAVTEPL